VNIKQGSMLHLDNKNTIILAVDRRSVHKHSENY